METNVIHSLEGTNMNIVYNSLTTFWVEKRIIIVFRMMKILCGHLPLKILHAFCYVSVSVGNCITNLFYIFLVHDESTFRSGEVSSKRWFLDHEAPFPSKGRGRSRMVSDFMVQHPSGPFFSLSEKEYKSAVRKYPEVSTINQTIYSFAQYFLSLPARR